VKKKNIKKRVPGRAVRSKRKIETFYINFEGKAPAQDVKVRGGREKELLGFKEGGGGVKHKWRRSRDSES